MSALSCPTRHKQLHTQSNTWSSSMSGSSRAGPYWLKSRPSRIRFSNVSSKSVSPISTAPCIFPRSKSTLTKVAEGVPSSSTLLYITTSPLRCCCSFCPLYNPSSTTFLPRNRVTCVNCKGKSGPQQHKKTAAAAPGKGLAACHSVRGLHTHKAAALNHLVTNSLSITRPTLLLLLHQPVDNSPN